MFATPLPLAKPATNLFRDALVLSPQQFDLANLPNADIYSLFRMRTVAQPIPVKPISVTKVQVTVLRNVLRRFAVKLVFRWGSKLFGLI